MKPQVEASEKDLAEATSYLASAIAAYADVLGGITTEMDVPAGTTSSLIFSTARYEHVDMVVMCSRGETGLKRWVLGSLAQQAVRHSPVPVLVLNAHGSASPLPEVTRPLRVLVPLDGSALSEAALSPAVQLITTLAATSQGELHLLRAVDLPLAHGILNSHSSLIKSMQEEARKEAEMYLETLTGRLLETTCTDSKLNVISSVVISMDAARTIITLAEQAEETEQCVPYDLIAMATHGRGGLQRLLMGSVTERVLGATKLPLLIVPSMKAEVKREKPVATTEAEVTTLGA
jgi:nucleotide-binding universal stress UspA family protein